VVDWLDRYNHLSYTSLVRGDELGLLNSIPTNRRHKSFHLISPEGEISSGTSAIPNLLALLPLGGVAASLLFLIPPGRSVVDFIYSTFARLHDSGSCSYKSSAVLSFTEVRKLEESNEKERNNQGFSELRTVGIKTPI
jgi:predicted DCC family thiol-disulfide oxidoreductase YuxK